jgi:hypothetical protein
MTLPKRRVGKTKLEVTTIGLGGAPMSGFRVTISEADGLALTDATYELGVRYFDTAPAYGYGRSELRIGAGLRDKPRDSFVLSTKVGRVVHALKPGEQPTMDFRENGLPGFAPAFDYTYDGVMRSIEDSCNRLGLALHPGRRLRLHAAGRPLHAFGTGRPRRRAKVRRQCQVAAHNEAAPGKLRQLKVPNLFNRPLCGRDHCNAIATTGFLG